MERHKFYKIIDDLTDHWYIDTIEPVTSKVKRVDGTVVSGPRPRSSAGDREGPNDTGWVQVVKWQPRPSYCPICQETVENAQQTINLRTGRTKCESCDQRKFRYSGEKTV